MAQTIAIDANGDMFLTGGNVTMLTNADAIGQDCITAMRAQLGEMQYAMQSGMPYFKTAFNTFTPIAFASAGKKVIRAVQGVVDVTQFNVQLIDNVLNYTATIETIFGQTFINGQS